MAAGLIWSGSPHAHAHVHVHHLGARGPDKMKEIGENWRTASCTRTRTYAVFAFTALSLFQVGGFGLLVNSSSSGVRVVGSYESG